MGCVHHVGLAAMVLNMLWQLELEKTADQVGGASKQ
jgi:hypothetical protein